MSCQHPVRSCGIVPGSKTAHKMGIEEEIKNIIIIIIQIKMSMEADVAAQGGGYLQSTAQPLFLGSHPAVCPMPLRGGLGEAQRH